MSYTVLDAYCTFDHSHIVRSISNGQCHGMFVLFHKIHHLLLLQRCDAAADDCRALAGGFEQIQFHFVFQGIALQ